MMVLVTGGSGSGKSAFAEERALSFGNPNAYYAATMEVMDGESVRRVERHRQMREGKGWITLEQPRDIEDITGRIRSYDSVVLVECLTNLVANEMYRGDEECENPKECIGKITGRLPLWRIRWKIWWWSPEMFLTMEYPLHRRFGTICRSWAM